MSSDATASYFFGAKLTGNVEVGPYQDLNDWLLLNGFDDLTSVYSGNPASGYDLFVCIKDTLCECFDGSSKVIVHIGISEEQYNARFKEFCKKAKIPEVEKGAWILTAHIA